MEPFKVLWGGPSPLALEGHAAGDKSLRIKPPYSPRSDAKPRVLVVRCKPCVNPYDARDSPVHLLASPTSYVLIHFTATSPHFHAAVDNVEPGLRIERIEFDTTLVHRFMQGCGGKMADI